MEDTLAQFEHHRLRVDRALKEIEDRFKQKLTEANNAMAPALSELIMTKNDALQAYGEFEEFQRLTVGSESLFFQDYDRMLGKIWHAIRKAQALLEKFETSPPPVFTTRMAVTHAGDAKLPVVFLDVHQVMDEEAVRNIPLPPNDRALE